MSAMEWLRLIAPDLAKDECKAQALFRTAYARLPCKMPYERQDEAVAYFAASVLANAVPADGIAPVGVTSEREGDLSRSYGDTGDRYGFKKRFDELVQPYLRVGAMTVGMR